MTRPTHGLAVSLMFAVMAAAAPVPKGLKMPGTFIPLEVGTRWEYVDADSPNTVVNTREITAIEQKVGATFATQKVDGIVQVIRADATGVATVKSNGSDYTHPRYSVKNGMKEGDEWEWNSGGGYVEKRIVGKSGRIKVPAGEFEAVKMTFGTNGSETTAWYADGVGLVRVDYTTIRKSHVLKAFTGGTGTKK